MWSMFRIKAALKEVCSKDFFFSFLQMYQLCNIEHTHSFSVEAYISMDSFANITGFLLRILVAGERCNVSS